MNCSTQNIMKTKTYKIKDIFDNAPKTKKDKVVNKVVRQVKVSNYAEPAVLLSALQV